MEFSYFIEVEQTRLQKLEKNKQYGAAKKNIEKFKKLESEEYKAAEKLFDKIKDEKDALEEKYNYLNSIEKEEMLKIERKPHENLEFINRITMFESFYNDMWEKPG